MTLVGDVKDKDVLIIDDMIDSGVFNNKLLLEYAQLSNTNTKTKWSTKSSSVCYTWSLYWESSRDS
jgi:hypoxanthine-guanine phosphoribosyltransferase